MPSDGARRTLANDFNRWAAFSNRWRCAAEPGLDVPPVPGERNRQETRDVARLTRGVHSRFRQTPYVLLIEDDFVLCDAALPKILGLLSPTAGIVSRTIIAEFSEGSQQGSWRTGAGLERDPALLRPLRHRLPGEGPDDLPRWAASPKQLERLLTFFRAGLRCLTPARHRLPAQGPAALRGLHRRPSVLPSRRHPRLLLVRARVQPATGGRHRTLRSRNPQRIFLGSGCVGQMSSRNVRAGRTGRTSTTGTIF